MRQAALVSGPTAIRAASSMRPPRPAFQPVPFPWDLAPRNSKPVLANKSDTGAIGVVAPANSATPFVVVEYQVPDGFQFVLTHRITEFTGATVIGSGDILWTTDVNVTPGITTPQGFPVEGMANETMNVGSFIYGPFPVYGCLIFEPNDVVRIKAANVAAGVGAPNYFLGALMGWIWPVK